MLQDVHVPIQATTFTENIIILVIWIRMNDFQLLLIYNILYFDST